jgi:sugar transferase (PEP-CTERM/EpsH1 system associated)
MVSMKILFLAHRIPYPPDKGEKIRAYQQLRFLAAHHVVDLFAFADPAERSAGMPALAPLCREMYFEELTRGKALVRVCVSLLTGRPFTTGYYHSSTMEKAVRAALSRNDYDAILVYCSAMAHYVADCTSVPVCVDFVDSDASKWAQYARYSRFPMSWLYAREARKLGKYERDVARTARRSFVSTPLEIEAIDPDGRLGVQTLKNGVATPARRGTVRPEIARLGTYVVFVGQMDYLPNVDAACHFANDILPKIRRRHPHLQFAIVGRNPSNQVKRLASLPGVIVTGTVPEVQPYLENAAVAVAPFRICQGVQNKILEALAIGLPVVATPRPARAIGATSAELLFVAETPDEFASAVIRVLEEPQLRSGSNGCEFVQSHFDWEQNLQPLELWLQEVTGENRRVSDNAINYVAAG